MTYAADGTDAVHVPRPLPHPRSRTVFWSAALAIGALAATLVTFAAHFTMLAFMAGLATISVGRRVLDDINESPAHYRDRNAVVMTVAAAGVSTGIAACALAGLTVAAFS